ncbi:MAG TPA: response regulator transcription factor [Clostridia bacterium]|nr:response regulator transcription factor [Clostridia bacterium]
MTSEGGAEFCLRRECLAKRLNQFLFDLPVAEKCSHNPSRLDISPVIRVWLVDGNKPFRNTVAGFLNQTEDLVCCQEFSTAEDALEALAEQAPPNLVLIDIKLRGLSGIEALEHFRIRAALTRVVILTDLDDAGNISKAIYAGASGYLLKSSPIEKIIESVRDVQRGGASMTPLVARSVLDMFCQLSAPRKDYGFTPREHKILELMTQGLLVKQIAGRLNVSYHTVDTHVRNIYAKLNVHTRTDAVAKVLREHLL